MVVGLVLRLTAVASVRDAVSFDYQMFFNLLLPPIILSSGYELHQVSHCLANRFNSAVDLSRATSFAT